MTWNGRADFSGYTDLTLGSGWTHTATSERTQAILGSGMVTVFLTATKASFAAGEVIATLPVGMRPAPSATRSRIRIIGQSASTLRFASILTDGSGQIVTDAAGTGGIIGNAVTFPLGG